MIVVEQSWSWEQTPPSETLQILERAGRTCYKSEHKITPESSKKFIKQIYDSGHHSVIEHCHASVRIITDRGVTHELVRHRIASFSQESTRYCNYGGDHIKFIRPVWCSDMVIGIFTIDNWCQNSFSEDERIWINSLVHDEIEYNNLLHQGWRPEQARSVLPNSLKTEIIVTANIREWIHVFNLRCSPRAHPQIRELMLSVKRGFSEIVPILFD